MCFLPSPPRVWWELQGPRTEGRAPCRLDVNSLKTPTSLIPITAHSENADRRAPAVGVGAAAPLEALPHATFPRDTVRAGQREPASLPPGGHHCHFTCGNTAGGPPDSLLFPKHTTFQVPPPFLPCTQHCAPRIAHLTRLPFPRKPPCPISAPSHSCPSTHLPEQRPHSSAHAPATWEWLCLCPGNGDVSILQPLMAITKTSRPCLLSPTVTFSSAGTV